MKVTYKFLRKVSSFVDLLVCEATLYILPFRTSLINQKAAGSSCSSSCDVVKCVCTTQNR